ncbi:metallophosphoesterase family protein [Nocardia crassostreae]|uniref:metallophosphoesterase family protein n=1 Tax=Nocardia crassostreae TaxID=53428 RepID=UPI000829F6DF|nr:metallophosphoesterase [Nocardia crassostreae]
MGSNSGNGRVVRIAAIGDLHMTEKSIGRFRPAFQKLAEHADVLLLAGDLTNGGTLRAGGAVGGEVSGLPVPVVAVLGNHDYERGDGPRIAEMLAERGVRVLDGDATVLELNGIRLCIAGVVGGSGGFPGYPGNPDEGTEEHRERFRRGPIDAGRLRTALENLYCDVRVALTHFSPILETLTGEPTGIYSHLGCADLGEAVDAGGAALAIHGHAHAGTEFGRTAGGVEVRNVAYPVIRSPYRVYELTA